MGAWKRGGGEARRLRVIEIPEGCQIVAPDDSPGWEVLNSV